MIDLAITGGRVLDPAHRVDRVADLLIEGGRVTGIAAAGAAPAARAVVDADGLWVTPGLIDMHVHLREPGGEHKETIATGVAAAVAGGFTTVAAMANTDPVNDSVEVTRWVLARAREAGLAAVLPIAAVTHGLAGETLTDFAALKDAGAVAFSDDGMPIESAETMRAALAAARAVGAPVITHAEDRALAHDCVMHAGAVADELGLPGAPAAAESEMVVRDCALARETGGHVHVAHVSAAASVVAIREAAGAPVSAEVAPHHFTLAADAVARCGTMAKMNPPLRDQTDIAALRTGLADGTLAVIASDHAPHDAREKARGMLEAPFGIVGLETTVGLTLALVHEGVLTPARAIAALTTGPARVLGLADRGHLGPGAVADISLLDPDRRWTVDPARFRSQGRNTPFADRELRGAAVGVCLGGRLVGDLDGRVRR